MAKERRLNANVGMPHQGTPGIPDDMVTLDDDPSLTGAPSEPKPETEAKPEEAKEPPKPQAPAEVKTSKRPVGGSAESTDPGAIFVRSCPSCGTKIMTADASGKAPCDACFAKQEEEEEEEDRPTRVLTGKAGGDADVTSQPGLTRDVKPETETQK